jgi:hypothetical protein
MTFAVFPLMSIGFSYPWYYCFSEVLDAVHQIIKVRAFIIWLVSALRAQIIQQGVDFCHRRLVAHLVLLSPRLRCLIFIIL